MHITVRGYAEQRFAAEKASLRLAAAIEGPERAPVFAEATGLLEPVQHALRDLAEQQAVTDWWTDQVRMEARRPWRDGRPAESAVHTARLSVQADFVDFEQLAAFLDRWGPQAGLEVTSLEWDVDEARRPAYEAQVRRRAVEDAVTKAQAYADAVRAHHAARRVTPLELADAGMLSGDGAHRPEPITMTAASGAASAPLQLAPQDVVVAVAVDGRFVAE